MPRPRLSSIERRQLKSQRQARWRQHVRAHNGQGQANQLLASHPFIYTRPPPVQPQEAILDNISNIGGWNNEIELDIEEDSLSKDNQEESMDAKSINQDEEESIKDQDEYISDEDIIDFQFEGEQVADEPGIEIESKEEQEQDQDEQAIDLPGIESEEEEYLSGIGSE